MGEPLIAAAVQMTSRDDVRHNLETAAALVRKAADRGARLVVLPENFALLSPREEDKLAHAEALDGARPGPILSAILGAARASGVWLVAGGMPEQVAGDPARVHNSCVAITPDGAIAAVYRKVHLFDVRTSDGIEYRESKAVAAGDRAILVETPWGGLGLSVCYDVRFPELYRELARRGARILAVPAAFTVPTGRDHWHVLLRARAVENQCFVIAAAQWGKHNDKRSTYGHSLIVDPWGTPLADAPDAEGVITAELDFARQDAIRQDLPVLGHRRL